jgi:hypothetical protein
MFSFFFFGTLQDDDLRELVLGRSIPREDIAKAILRGYRSIRLRSRVQPGIVEDPEGQVEGAVARHLDVAEASRISHYESGAYDIVLEPVDLLIGEQEKAWIFLSDPDLSAAPGEWSFKNWQQRHKPRSLVVARTWMARLNHAELASTEAEWRKRRLIDSGN